MGPGCKHVHACKHGNTLGVSDVRSKMGALHHEHKHTGACTRDRVKASIPRRLFPILKKYRSRRRSCTHEYTHHGNTCKALPEACNTHDTCMYGFGWVIDDSTMRARDTCTTRTLKHMNMHTRVACMGSVWWRGQGQTMTLPRAHGTHSNGTYIHTHTHTHKTQTQTHTHT